jgi:hypothetical protein
VSKVSNEVPVVSNYSVTVNEDTPVSGRIEATDSDGDQLIYTLTKSPENGMTVVASNGEWTYIPNLNFSGSDSFQVLVDDEKGGTAVSTVDITVNAVNDDPITKNEIVQTPKNIAVGGKIEVEDVDGDTLTFIVKQEPMNGKLILSSSDGQWIYTPNNNFVGVDEFQVLIDDGKGGTGISKIVIAVIPASTIFKQFSVMENVVIPEVKPDAEDIVNVIVDVEIIDKTIIKTPEAKSYEGQILTGWKVVVQGLLKQKIEYVADEPTQSMHCAHFDIPFTTYLVLPKSFKSCTPIDIKACIEDIYYQLLDSRTIFKNITLVLQACLIE